MIETATDVYLDAKKHRKYMELHVDKARKAAELCKAKAYERFCEQYRKVGADERYMDEIYKTVKDTYQKEYSLDSHWNGKWNGDYKSFYRALWDIHKAQETNKFEFFDDAWNTTEFHDWCSINLRLAMDVKKKTIVLLAKARDIEKAALDALADIIQLSDCELEHVYV